VVKKRSAMMSGPKVSTGAAAMWKTMREAKAEL
jgi:hypothetical protein